MTRVVSFSTNKSYQKYATALVKSLRSVYQEKIVCRCVNCEESFIIFLKDYNVDVIIDNIKLNKKKRLKNCKDTPILKSGNYNKNCLCDDEITYTCHSRFYNAKFIFEKYKDCVVALMDCDFLVIKNIDEMFNLSGNDIMIMDPINCVHEDCILISDTKNGRKFVDDILTILDRDLFFWDQDTIALKEAFNSEPCLKIETLDLKFKDYTLSDNSTIWSGDGHAKYNKKFIDKFNQIMLL